MFKEGRLILSKELNLDNKFKADKAWSGLVEKNDFVLLTNEDGSTTAGIKNKNVAEAYIQYMSANSVSQETQNILCQAFGD